MANKPMQEAPVVTKMYDFVARLMSMTARFDRAHRYTLGTRLEDGALETLELLVEASYTADKQTLLQRANRRIERLRYLARLAKDLKLISLAQYESICATLFDVGSDVGGWSRYAAGRADRSRPTSSADGTDGKRHL